VAPAQLGFVLRCDAAAWPEVEPVIGGSLLQTGFTHIAPSPAAFAGAVDM